MTDRQAKLHDAFAKVLDAIEPDWESDPHLAGTPARLARMYQDELCAGLYRDAPKLATYDAQGARDLNVIGPLTVRGLCAHHLMPVHGKAWVMTIPNDKLLGLSKYARVIEWAFARPTLQEHATRMAMDVLIDALEPLGLGIMVRAQHGCMRQRGVRDESFCTTSCVWGVLDTDPAARAEAFALVGVQG